MTLRIAPRSFTPPSRDDTAPPETTDATATPTEGSVGEANTVAEDLAAVAPGDNAVPTDDASGTHDDPDVSGLHLQQQVLFGGSDWLERLRNWGRESTTPAAPTEPAVSKPTAVLYPTAAAALDAGDAAAALRHLNGLSMNAMLHELDQLSPAQRAALYPALHVPPGQYANRSLPPVGLGQADGVRATCIMD